MMPHLSPAEVRTGARLMRIYREAGAHILAEEQAADALSLPTRDELVAARIDALIATPDGRARYTAYLDGLETTHGHDRAMRLVIDSGRARLAAHQDDPGHPGAVPDGDPPRVPDGPDHTAPADGEAAA